LAFILRTRLALVAYTRKMTLDNADEAELIEDIATRVGKQF
jgi:hypothetical protein